LTDPAKKKGALWVRICLLHLSIVAFLGMLLRSKIIFSLPLIDYKYLLNAHSHFAFGGWVSLMLMTLLVFEILPEEKRSGRKYVWLLGAIAVNAWGMLLSFPFQGYAFLSILFSTLFIFTTYIFSWVYIRDISRLPLNSSAKLLIITGLICLVVSSIGPFTLAYLLATHSGNFLLFKNAVYTYLHFQYNGFFTFSVLGILFEKIHVLSERAKRNTRLFSILLCTSILPSAFLSYLWQYPSSHYRFIALIGAITTLASVLYFALIFSTVRNYFTTPVSRVLGIMSLASFMLKMVLQSGTIVPAIGNVVFGDRPVIIGFLHLVFLGFVTLFAIAYLLQNNMVDIRPKITSLAVKVFAGSVILNEVILMSQGLGIMFQQNSTIYPWLLWIAGIGLFLSSLIVAISNMRSKMV
jgi:hypothetical protein